MNVFRATILLLIAALIGFAAARTPVRADDSDSQEQKMFPNRMKATPQPNETPPVHVIGIPNRESAPGSPLSPDAGSQMGIGLQFHFGGPSEEAKPSPTPSPLPSQPESRARRPQTPGNP